MSRTLVNMNVRVRRLINAFKTRVQNLGGTTEATDKVMYNELANIPHSILDKASIIITANGYGTGKLFSAIGDNTNKVVNGDFTTDSDWVKGANTTIVGGKAIFNYNGFVDMLHPAIPIQLVIGRKYSISFNITSYTSGTVRASIGGTELNGESVGLYTKDFTATSTTFLFLGSGIGCVASIDSVVVRDISTDMTWSRNSEKKVTNKEGVLVTAPVNTPMPTYSSVGNKPVIRLDPQRTNTVKFSEPTANENGGSGITYSSFAWENGFTNCVQFSDNSIVRSRYAGNSIANVPNVFSAYIIMDDLGEPIIGSNSVSGDFSIVIGARFCVVNGKQNVSGNIWRIWGVRTPTINLSFNGIVKYPSQSNRGFKVVGWQLTEGNYPVPYIPTNGAIVTRLIDVGINCGTVADFNSKEGTLFWEHKYNSNLYTSSKIAISDGTGNNRLYVTPFQNLSGRMRFLFTTNGVTQCSLQITGVDLTQNHKYAVVWKVNRFEIWMDGVKHAEDLTGVTPPENTFNQLHLGSELGNGTESLDGSFGKLYMFKEAFSASQIKKL